MSGIRLGANITALQTIGALERTGQAVNKVNERLSSGLRINRASDDAAGLAISTSLYADQRVFGQGIRNINDGISLLNIADGALTEATSIGIRMRELATQAANGSYSITQRTAINTEVNKLAQEFNRLVGTVKFNGRTLLIGDAGSLTIQAGYGLSGGLSIDLGSKLARNVGTGTFGSAGNTYSTGGFAASEFATADFNGDGKLDIVSATQAGFGVFVQLGDGQGGFGSSSSLTIGANPTSVITGDFNNDGKMDIAASSSGGQNVGIMLGNGDGTFQAAQTNSLGAGSHRVMSGDFNGDGKLDLVAQAGSGALQLLFGNGDGSLQTANALNSGSIAFDGGLQVADFNNDGISDIIASSNSDKTVKILYGNHSNLPSLGSTVTISGISAIRDLSVGDFDGNGTVDFALLRPDGGGGHLQIYSNQGSASFSLTQSLATANNVWSIVTSDLNGDGIPDLVTSDNNSSSVTTYMGSGNGQFQTGVANNLGVNVLGRVLLADFSGDGALDLIAATATGFGVYRPDTTRTSNLPRLDIFSAAQARDSFGIIDAFMERVTRERSALGAYRNRLEVAANNLQSARDEYYAAEGRISNADIAQESSEAVKIRILQSIGASVLAQANQQPALALQLLR